MIGDCLIMLRVLLPLLLLLLSLNYCHAAVLIDPLPSNPSTIVTDNSTSVAVSVNDVSVVNPSPSWPCSWTSPDGASFDLSGLTTAQGTAVSGQNSDAYGVNVCGLASGEGMEIKQ
jgi:hypothetical protein